ncbi:FAD/NAD(P)-binding protein [Streptomyces sp. FH025]|uniref:FAD/NAD(P)-binding protein n=1 Tax=Streptomyces sp. FH025 TaxID=2815937 RepID=UPI001A9D078F|nr:FAD/NAD(P)-binding protein [Streptomyces sp. FH025]MBO1414080.1 FAD/NAD(P)-binding protein [Streptomyces sp. FH025]
MTPVPYRVLARRRESADTVTLDLVAAGAPLRTFRPGQYAMLYAFGVGEIPLSVSGIDGPVLRHTVRAVGKVSEALCRAGRGDLIGARGPYGTAWRTPPSHSDVLIVSGGIGLAPLRPLIEEVLNGEAEFGTLAVLTGYRDPGEQLFLEDLSLWRARADVLVTVDHPEPGWSGATGLVTGLLDAAAFRPDHCAAYLCGPEAMMRATARDLLRRGVAAERVQVSLERNMRCATGWCGHCQLGPVLLCRDGPILGWDRAESLLSTPEV